MANIVECSWAGGLHRFRLFSSPFEPVDLSTVTEIELKRDTYGFANNVPDSASIRWNQSEFKKGEVVALLPDGFKEDTGLVKIQLYGPGQPNEVFGTCEIGSGGEFVGGSGVYLEQCDICGKWFDINTLVRQLQVRKRSIAANYLPYSRYNSTYWNCTTDYLGEASMGRSRFRDVVDPDGGPSRMVDGAASFWGDGVLTAIEQIDVQAWDTVLVEGQFGTNQRSVQGTLDVVIGLIFDKGSPNEKFYQLGSFSGVNGRRVFGSISVSSIDPAHRPYVRAEYRITTATNQEVWWGERFRVQKDKTVPDMTWVPTKGTALVHTEEGKMLGRTVVCPKDWERLPKQIDGYRPNFDAVPTLEDENQEL